MAAITETERIHVGAVADLPPGTRVMVDARDRSGVQIGVFSTRHGFYAVRNHCPHHGAPLCEGRFGGTTFGDVDHDYILELEDRVLSCPWHHWEFDVSTGRSLVDPKVRARVYPVVVEDGQVYVELRGRRGARDTGGAHG